MVAGRLADCSDAAGHDGVTTEADHKGRRLGTPAGRDFAAAADSAPHGGKVAGSRAVGSPTVASGANAWSVWVRVILHDHPHDLRRVRLCGQNDLCGRSVPWWNWWKSRRYIVTLMGFLGYFIIYSLRASLSLAIIKMTQKVNVTFENGTIMEIQEFNWDSKDQGLILSAFFYGFTCTQFLGGILASRFGGHIVFGLGHAGSSCLAILSVPVAKFGFYPFMAIRILVGLFEGVTVPSMQQMCASWAPIYERTIISGIVNAGGQVGVFVSFLVSGVLIQHLGWESGFGSIWFVIWMIFIKKNPASDPRISEEEKTYIESNIVVMNNQGKGHIPWKSILTSSAVYSVIICHACDSWSSYTFVTLSPTYLRDVLGTDLGTTGFLSAAPYLMFIIVIFITGPLSDYLRSSKILTTQQVRKFGVGIGFLISGLFLVIMSNVTSLPAISSCLIIAIGVSAISKMSSMANPLDFAPTHSAIIIGISYTFATIPGIVAPTFAGFIVQNGSLSEWQTVFYTAAGVHFFGTIIFSIFAKGEIQKWSEDTTSTQ
uniref:Major facilitator superfamily (MFS) profile domain-containing protein n=1 Tax=Phlebotomus papatasi TaxID=29031 RepID=A0A1B0DPV0_PHLPP